MLTAQRRVLKLTDPAFTWAVNGDLLQVTYAGGQTKAFAYDGLGRVSTIDFLSGGVTRRKTFTYDAEGNVSAINEEVLL